MSVIPSRAKILQVSNLYKDYSNVLYTSYMPILSSAVFDNKGEMYNVTRVLTNDFVFDPAEYQSYSRVFMSTTYVLSYALQFAAVPALIVHTICWHGRDTVQRFKESWREAKHQIIPNKNALDRPLSNQSASSVLSRASTAPIMDSLLSEEEMAKSAIGSESDVPISWYIFTGISMTLVGIFLVEQ
jgi:hypothetical protein